MANSHQMFFDQQLDADTCELMHECLPLNGSDDKTINYFINYLSDLIYDSSWVTADPETFLNWSETHSYFLFHAIYSIILL